MIGAILILLLASYLLGAVPFGLILVKMRGGVDLRSTGSGNVGATNVARSAGHKLGAITLVLDAGKGLVPVLAARFFFAQTQFPVDLISAAAGYAAFLGHVTSPFLGFRGGKGVATALGVLLASAPLVLLPALLVFVAVVKRWGYISLGSMSAAVSAPMTSLLLGYSLTTFVLTLLLALIIIFRHRENIQRLRQGTENPWRRSTRTAESR